MTARAIGSLVAAIVLTVASAACGSTQKVVSPFKLNGISWVAPADPMKLARAAGLVPETAERLQYHVHSHLDVFAAGRPIVVPAGLGIDTNDPAVHRSTTLGAPAYGGIFPACAQVCISPLHTHDITGILHTESATKQNNTLGQLFVEWGVRLDPECVSTFCKPDTAFTVYVNGVRHAGDPRTIPLTNHEEIAVVIGPPPARIPATADWSGL